MKKLSGVFLAVFGLCSVLNGFHVLNSIFNTRQHGSLPTAILFMLMSFLFAGLVFWRAYELLRKTDRKL